MHKVIYKHWKTDTILEITGVILHDNPISDRIVIEKTDGGYEDILRDTIITVEEIAQY